MTSKSRHRYAYCRLVFRHPNSLETATFVRYLQTIAAGIDKAVSADEARRASIVELLYLIRLFPVMIHSVVLEVRKINGITLDDEPDRRIGRAKLG